MSTHARRPITAEDLWKLPRVGAPLPARDGSFVLVPVTTFDLENNEAVERIHRVAEDGATRPLTVPDRSSSQPALSPDDAKLAFVRKPPEKDKPQVHVMAVDGGEARSLSDFPLGAADPRWLPDGKRLACVSWVFREAPTLEGTRKLIEQRDKNPVKANVTEDRLFRFWDTWLTDGKVPHLFLIDIETGAVRDLTPDSERWFDFMDPSGQFDVAPDGKEIVFSANSSRSPHERLRWAIFRVPIDGGSVDCLTPDNPADDFRPRYSPDGRFVLYGMQKEWDFYADRVRLARLDRSSGETTVLTEDWDRSASSWEFAPGSDTVVFEAENHGRVEIYRLPIGGGTPDRLGEGGTAHAPRATTGGIVYCQYQDLSSPPEVARLPLQGGKIERLTRFTAECLGALALGKVEEIEVAGAAGEPVQAFVVYPPGFDSSRRWPLVHLIHGGPHGIFGDQFHFRWNAQAFAAPGYISVMTNFHGSTSFGQRFASSIMGSWGDQPMTDLMAVTDALIERGFVDPERLAITGGSYGGYMTAWLTSQTDRFACSVCHAGVINLPAMYASDVTQGSRRSYGGEPWDGREAIERWSPAAFARGFTTPTLVIHGEKDYRVPVTQGFELYGILKAKGVEARLVHYPDENHWILKPQNSIHWYGEVLGWLERFLSAESAPGRRAERQTAAVASTTGA